MNDIDVTASTDEALWFPVPPPQDQEALREWSVAVSEHWAASLGSGVTTEARAYRQAVLELAAQYFDEQAPTRAFWLVPGSSGVMFDFVSRPVKDDRDWQQAHRSLLEPYCSDAVEAEWLTSDIDDVRATVSLATFEDDSDADALGNTVGYAQLVAVARRTTPTGDLDIIARAVDYNQDVIEMSAYAALSFLHGDELLAAVQAD